MDVNYGYVRLNVPFLHDCLHDCAHNLSTQILLHVSRASDDATILRIVFEFTLDQEKSLATL